MKISKLSNFWVFLKRCSIFRTPLILFLLVSLGINIILFTLIRILIVDIGQEIRLQKDSPTPTLISQRGVSEREVYLITKGESLFQKWLARYCNKGKIKYSNLPVKIDFYKIDLDQILDGDPICNHSYANGAVHIGVGESGYEKHDCLYLVYDKYTVEDGIAIFQLKNFGEGKPVIKKPSGIELEFGFSFSELGISLEAPILVRGRKPFSVNGENFYVLTGRFPAINAEDPRLKKILNKYSTASEITEELIIADPSAAMKEIEEVFLQDLGSLDEQGRNNITKIERNLGAIAINKRFEIFQ